MAEIVSSAVVGEAVNKICSFMAGKCEEHAIAEERAERMEMALLKIQTAVEEANGWQIRNRPLLCWKAKLKHVADEGGDILHTYKRRILEDKQEDTASSYSFPKRIACVAKRFFSFGGAIDEPSSSTVRRFERLADGIGDFMKFVEYGGRPKRFIFFHSVNSYLLSGKFAISLLRMGSGVGIIFAYPWIHNPEHGLPEASVLISYCDETVLEKNFDIGMSLSLSECIDVMSIATKCLELFRRLFKSSYAVVKKEIAQLMVQELAHAPVMDSAWYERWTGSSSSLLNCGKDYGRKMSAGRGKAPELEELPDYLNWMFIECYIPQPNQATPRPTRELPTLLAKNTPPPFKLSCYIFPHFPLELSNSQGAKNTHMFEVLSPVHQNKQHGKENEPRLLSELLSKAIEQVRLEEEVAKYQARWLCSHGGTCLSSECLVN